MEGRHSAFPSVPPGTLFPRLPPRKAPVGAREGRMPSLRGPHVPPKPTRCRARDARLATCRTWRGTGLWREGILPSLACRQARSSTLARRKAPIGAREGRMPSLQGPHVPPKPTRCRARNARLAACRTWRRDGPLEGRHSAFPGVPSGTLLLRLPQEKRLSALREGRMPSLQGPHVPSKPTRCRAKDARLAACRTWRRDGPLEGRHSAFPSVPSGTLLLRLPQEKRPSALGKAGWPPSGIRTVGFFGVGL